VVSSTLTVTTTRKKKTEPERTRVGPTPSLTGGSVRELSCAKLAHSGAPLATAAANPANVPDASNSEVASWPDPR
jgi:hypothetical protein